MYLATWAKRRYLAILKVIFWMITSTIEGLRSGTEKVEFEGKQTVHMVKNGYEAPRGGGWSGDEECRESLERFPENEKL